MIDAVERSQAYQMAAVEGWMMDMLSIDESDAVYQSFRSKTTMGLEVGRWLQEVMGLLKESWHLINWLKCLCKRKAF
jgi:hypothetical protein